MTVQRVGVLQNLGTVYSAEEFRRYLRALVPSRQAGPDSVGVLGSGDFLISQNGTPNMSVNAAAGEAVARGSETSSQGDYYLYNDATVNRTIATADATNPRNDLAVLRVRDQVYSGTNNDGDVFIVQGTPAATPVDPALPANCIRLARVRVNAGATSITNANITDLRQWVHQYIHPGAPVFAILDSTMLKKNLQTQDSGFVTLRGPLVVPATVDGTPVSTAYGTVPVKIAQLLPSGVNSITQSIPNSFSTLEVYWRARDTGTGTTATGANVQFNTDSGAHYSWDGTKNANGGAVTPEGATATTSIPGFATTGGNQNANAWAHGEILIPRYVDAVYQHLLARFSFNDATGAWKFDRVGDWEPTTPSAITVIAFLCGTGNFAAGTTIDIYGKP